MSGSSVIENAFGRASKPPSISPPTSGRMYTEASGTRTTGRFAGTSAMGAVVQC